LLEVYSQESHTTFNKVLYQMVLHRPIETTALTGQVPADSPKVRLWEIEISVWSLPPIVGG
jgi:hypothetical protein